MNTHDRESQELAYRLGLLSDEELTRRCAAGTFTTQAHGIAATELRSRGLAAPALPALEPDTLVFDATVEEPAPYHGDIVTVARRFTPIDAQVLCACLEAAGIPATVADAGLVQTNLLWSIALGGASVRVPQAFVQEANDLIAAFERGELSLDENFDPTP